MPAPTDHRLARFAYPVGLLLILAPLLELAGRAWPLQWYLIQWRFQTELAVINAAPVILIGALVMVLVAWSDESAGMLKLMGIMLVTFGVLLLPTFAMAVMDGMQLRQIARSELRGNIRNNIIVTAMRGLLSAIAAVSLGVGAMKAAGALGAADISPRRTSASRRDEESDNELLVVGGGND